ncbi:MULTISPECIES: hypothetical protein [unclassified Moorena]|uniref:hypothetical protein n=1 Tax=unclassified Moorena TaxID=2683338 RepID=UPI0014005662|nr:MULTISPECIES: hypothetical protein [unclassified Moorena]NEO13400.1 hypothetical protein [Moorena sp. SIO3E8]NEQ00736.1 hypothetical protein [Moorena sp. SIO3F7]
MTVGHATRWDLGAAKSDWPLTTLRSGSVSAKPTLRERKAWPKGLSFRAYAIAYSPRGSKVRSLFKWRC